MTRFGNLSQIATQYQVFNALLWRSLRESNPSFQIENLPIYLKHQRHSVTFANCSRKEIQALSELSECLGIPRKLSVALSKYVRMPSSSEKTSDCVAIGLFVSSPIIRSSKLAKLRIVVEQDPISHFATDQIAIGPPRKHSCLGIPKALPSQLGQRVRCAFRVQSLEHVKYKPGFDTFRHCQCSPTRKNKKRYGQNAQKHGPSRINFVMLPSDGG
jgi:hypothetical protein